MQFLFPKTNAIRLRFIIDFFLFANIFIGLCIVGLTFQSFAILGFTDDSCWLFLLVFSATIVTYSLHRFLSHNQKKTKLHPMPYQWVSRNKFLVLSYCSAAVFTIAYSACQLSLGVIIALSPMVILSLLYLYPILLIKGNKYRIKDLQMTKIWVISFVISYVTLLLPSVMLMGFNAFVDFEIVLLFLERFLFIVAITIPFDIRDMNRDKADGLMTLPIWAGKQKAIFLSLSLLGMSYLVAIFHTAFGVSIVPADLFPLGISLMITAIIIVETKKDQHDYFYSFIVEGTMLLYAFSIGIG